MELPPNSGLNLEPYDQKVNTLALDQRTNDEKIGAFARPSLFKFTTGLT